MAQKNQTIRDLLHWGKNLRTTLHPDMEVYQDPVTGLSFRAVRDIRSDTKLVNCSYEVTLSYLNAIDAPGFPRNTNVPFPRHFLSTLGLEPNIIGHFFLMQQYLLKEKSFWWPYIRLLPQPDQPSSIPALWPDEDQRYLDGTNAEPAIKKRTDLWAQEWRKGMDLLRHQFEGWEKYTHPLYKWAASIFGSRSFRPSLTIPKELVPDHKEQLAKDRFSILLPIMDIGNHNGINDVDWALEPATRIFVLSNRGPIRRNEQIFNYYGNKSNSELLVAYGFTLPTTPELDRDVINLKLKPEAESLKLWRSQSCHITPKEPDEEFMFAVQKRIDGRGQKLGDFMSFSNGLVDLVICIVANKRERRYIAQNLDYCPEKDTAIFETPLARTAFRALHILLAKLVSEIDRITPSAIKRYDHTKSNHEIALDYARKQLSVLIAVRWRLVNRFGAIFTPRIFFPSDADVSLNSTLYNVELLSLQGAFKWLHINYPDIHDPVVQLISEDQEEPLPINWAILVEDWDHTYWVVWIFIVWLLWAREGEAFRLRYRSLSCWLLEMNRAYDDEIETPGNEVLQADASEIPTINLMIQEITKIPPFSTLHEWLQPDANVTKIRNFASFVSHEETILTNHSLWTSDSKEGVGESGGIPDQKVLCITHGFDGPETGCTGSWTKFMGQKPRVSGASNRSATTSILNH